LGRGLVDAEGGEGVENGQGGLHFARLREFVQMNGSGDWRFFLGRHAHLGLLGELV
jgi:hypothetical protein